MSKNFDTNTAILKIKERFDILKREGTFSEKAGNRTILEVVDDMLGRDGRSLATLGYKYGVQRLRSFAEIRPVLDSYYGEPFPAERLERLNNFPEKLDEHTTWDFVKTFFSAFGEQVASLGSTNFKVLYWTISNAYWIAPLGFAGYLFYKHKAFKK